MDSIYRNVLQADYSQPCYSPQVYNECYRYGQTPVGPEIVSRSGFNIGQIFGNLFGGRQDYEGDDYAIDRSLYGGYGPAYGGYYGYRGSEYGYAPGYQNGPEFQNGPGYDFNRGYYPADYDGYQNYGYRSGFANFGGFNIGSIASMFGGLLAGGLFSGIFRHNRHHQTWNGGWNFGGLNFGGNQYRYASHPGYQMQHQRYY